MLDRLKNRLGLSIQDAPQQTTMGTTLSTQTAQPDSSSAFASGASTASAAEHRSSSSGRYLTIDQRTVSFEEIYDHAAVKPSRMSYNILKIAEMANSPHLTGMPPDSKRASLLMALEAASAEIEDLLQDAVVRQRALNDFEAEEQNRLREFEVGKAEENRRLQASIQSNLDEVARAQESFRAWQKRKQQEAHRIAEAAAFCVPQGSAAPGGNLTTVLERAVSFGR
jgi:hypothetical protein